MSTLLDYDRLHRSRQWAYGQRPDAELIRSLTAVPPGTAVDLGGGQGRHALALARLGFQVAVVDSSQAALDQALARAHDEGVALKTVRAEIGFYQPPAPLALVVAALILHLPARHASLQAAQRLGGALQRGGLFYLSVPGFSAHTRQLVSEVLVAAGCRECWVVNHLVTPQERPRLPVPRRNETRALGTRR